MIDDELRAKATKILDACRRRKLKLALAESCTGGLIGAALTEIPGSSDVVDRGYVTYSNEAKAAMLGVPTETLRQFGAVSAETVRAMAEGALAKSGADVTVAVTGIAGPGGGSGDKPVGLVHFAAAHAGRTLHKEIRFGDLGRGEIRRRSVLAAIELLNELIAAD
ncbi:MAG TPA: CinA family protein [Pseudolabrys sp.]|nr:CinA family protein [Pseudolabrys sp.]